MDNDLCNRSILFRSNRTTESIMGTHSSKKMITVISGHRRLWSWYGLPILPLYISHNLFLLLPFSIKNNYNFIDSKFKTCTHLLY